MAANPCYALFAASTLLIVPLCADVMTNEKSRPPNPAELELNRAIGSLSKQQLSEAARGFQESLRLDPKNVRALLGLAKVDIERKDAPAGGRHIQAALALAPNDANVQEVWGHYLFWQKRYREAETSFKKTIQLDSHSVQGHFELGNVYLLGMHRPKDAVAAYRTAVVLDPKRAGTHYMLANALAANGDMDGAQAEFEEVVRQDPKNPSMYSVLGTLYAKRGRYDQAHAAFKRAVDLQPGFLPALVASGEAYSSAGQFDRAVGEYRAALKVSPKFADVYTKIGVAEQRSSHNAQARAAYLEGIKIDAKQVMALNNLAWLAISDKQDLTPAVEWAKTATALAPDSATCQDTLGWVYRARHEYNPAVRALGKANSLRPHDPQILYHLGAAYAESGQREKAKVLLHEALSASKPFEGDADAKAMLATISR